MSHDGLDGPSPCTPLSVSLHLFAHWFSFSRSRFKGVVRLVLATFRPRKSHRVGYVSRQGVLYIPITVSAGWLEYHVLQSWIQCSWPLRNAVFYQRRIQRSSEGNTNPVQRVGVIAPPQNPLHVFTCTRCSRVPVLPFCTLRVPRGRHSSLFFLALLCCRHVSFIDQKSNPSRIESGCFILSSYSQITRVKLLTIFY